MKNLYKLYKNMCKSFKYYKLNCDVIFLLNVLEDVYNQECLFLFCVVCGRKENIERCDCCYFVGYFFKFC